MDLTIPGGMGGREAVARLRELDPDVRAVVASGYSTDDALAGYKQAGFVGGPHQALHDQRPRADHRPRPGRPLKPNVGHRLVRLWQVSPFPGHGWTAGLQLRRVGERERAWSPAVRGGYFCRAARTRSLMRWMWPRPSALTSQPSSK